MVENTLIYNSTPEKLTGEILRAFDSKLNELKKEFEPKQPTELLTRQEAANLLKINLSTLYHWTKKGLVKSYGIGNRVYYKRKEIENSLTKLNH